MRAFRTLEDIRNASVEQLKAADGMNARAAAQVYDFFHAQEKE